MAEVDPAGDLRPAVHHGIGNCGIEIHAAGSATFANTTVSGSGTGGLLNDTGFVVDRLGGDSGF